MEMLTAVDFVEALTTIDKLKKKPAGHKARERRKKQEASGDRAAKQAAEAKKKRTPGAMTAPDDVRVKEPRLVTIDGDDDDADDGKKTALVASAAPKKPLTAVQRFRRQARKRAKDAANARREGGTDAANAYDRMQAINKANEDADVEQMMELLKGLVDMSRVVLMGHSFGAVTALQAAAARPGAFAGVVALDPWAFPIDAEVMQRGVGNVPVLALLCPRFAEPWNGRAIRTLVDYPSRVRAAELRRSGVDPAKIDTGVPRSRPIADASTSNGVDSHTGYPLVDLVVPTSPPDWTVGVIERSEHQSFSDTELIAEPLLRLVKQTGAQPAAASMDVIRRTVVRWVAERVLRRSPPTGRNAPSSAAMLGSSPALVPVEAKHVGSVFDWEPSVKPLPDDHVKHDEGDVSDTEDVDPSGHVKGVDE
jgi:pimeloyl-ACP methyl ester carboxylesterase